MFRKGSLLRKVARPGLLKVLPLFLIDWIMPKDRKTFIYGAFDGKGYGENSRFFFEYAVGTHPEFRHYWITADPKTYGKLKKRYPYNVVYAKSLRGFWLALRAKYVFISKNITDVFYSLTRRHIIINLWHGIPLKRIERCAKNTAYFPASRKPKSFLFGNRFSYIIASSAMEKMMLSRCFEIPTDRVIITGQPRNDIIRTSKLDDELSYLRNFNHVVLYAPTLREKGEPRFFPFRDMDYRGLERFLVKNKILILLRGHRSNLEIGSDGEFNITQLKNVEALNHDRVADINTIFRYIDLAINDYSSMFFDFLLTDKPVMFIPYDLREFHSLRGFLYEYKGISPGPKVYSFAEFKTELLRLLNDREYFLGERRIVKDLLFRYQDSQASKRIFNFILSGRPPLD